MRRLGGDCDAASFARSAHRLSRGAPSADSTGAANRAELIATFGGCRAAQVSGADSSGSGPWQVSASGPQFARMHGSSAQAWRCAHSTTAICRQVNVPPPLAGG
jgi:hypothetical protein